MQMHDLYLFIACMFNIVIIDRRVETGVGQVGTGSVHLWNTMLLVPSACMGKMVLVTFI